MKVFYFKIVLINLLEAAFALVQKINSFYVLCFVNLLFVLFLYRAISNKYT